MSLPCGRQTTEYSAAGLPTKLTDPLAREVDFAYDASGNLTAQSDAAGSSTATYDPAGRISSRTDAVGATTHFEYDADST